jgi:hypothetical protein
MRPRPCWLSRVNISRIVLLTKPRTFKQEARAFPALKRMERDEQESNSAVALQFWGWLHAATSPLVRRW